MRVLICPFLAVLFALGLSLSACEDDDIGQPCSEDRDCEGICAGGKDFPGGLCTWSCEREGQCPKYWVCAEKSGGLCLLTCPDTPYCEEHFGRDWRCKDEKLEGGGKEKVCVGD